MKINKKEIIMLVCKNGLTPIGNSWTVKENISQEYNFYSYFLKTVEGVKIHIIEECSLTGVIIGYKENAHVIKCISLKIDFKRRGFETFIFRLGSVTLEEMIFLKENI